MMRGRARFSSALVQHGCKRRPYGLSARALSSLEVSYSYIRNSKDDKQVCNRRLSSTAIMTPFCQRWSRDFRSQAPPLFSRALKRSGRLGTRLLPDYLTTPLPDYSTTSLNDYITTRLPHYLTTSLNDYITTPLTDYPTTLLPNYLTIRLPDYPTTGLPHPLLPH